MVDHGRLGIGRWEQTTGPHNAALHIIADQVLIGAGDERAQTSEQRERLQDKLVSSLRGWPGSLEPVVHTASAVQ